MNDDDGEELVGVVVDMVDMDNDSTTSTTAHVPVPLLPSDEEADVPLDLRLVLSSVES